MVEYHVANVVVAGSIPVSRSFQTGLRGSPVFAFVGSVDSLPAAFAIPASGSPVKEVASERSPSAGERLHEYRRRT